MRPEFEIFGAQNATFVGRNLILGVQKCFPVYYLPR